jgi:hypothetical protein
MAKFPGNPRSPAISAPQAAKPTRFTHPISENLALDAFANELQ